MKIEIKTVFETFDSLEADMAIATLKEANIVAFDNRNSYLSQRFGRTFVSNIQVQVSAEDFDKSLGILQNIGIINKEEYVN